MGWLRRLIEAVHELPVSSRTELAEPAVTQGEHSAVEPVVVESEPAALSPAFETATKSVLWVLAAVSVEQAVPWVVVAARQAPPQKAVQESPLGQRSQEPQWSYSFRHWLPTGQSS